MSETSAGTKEESSDESTIVSSQPSTLTRNQRNAFNFVYLLVDRSFYHLFLFIGGPMSGLEVDEEEEIERVYVVEPIQVCVLVPFLK